MSSKPYSGERRCCRFCNQPVTFMRTAEGVIKCLDSTVATYEIVPDLNGEETAVPAGALVAHALICSKIAEATAAAKRRGP